MEGKTGRETITEKLRHAGIQQGKDINNLGDVGGRSQRRNEAREYGRKA